jgi:hypothetical protein
MDYVLLHPVLVNHNSHLKTLDNVRELALQNIIFLVLMEDVLLQVINVDLYMNVLEVKLDVKMDLVDL